MASWTSLNSMIIWGRMAEADVPVRILSFKTPTKRWLRIANSVQGEREQVCTVARQFLLRVRDSRKTKTEEELDQNQPRKGNKGKGLFWLVLFICSLPNSKSWSLGYLKFSQTFLASYFLHDAHVNTLGNSELRVCLILKYQFCRLGKSREILCQRKKIFHPWVGFSVVFSAPGRCSCHLSTCAASYAYWLVLGNVW